VLLWIKADAPAAPCDGVKLFLSLLTVRLTSFGLLLYAKEASSLLVQSWLKGT